MQTAFSTLAVPEQKGRHRAACKVIDRRPAPPGWGPGDRGVACLAWRRWGDKLSGLSIDL
jgi:hypothetical protein